MIVRVYHDSDDLDPELFCCSSCGHLWASMAAARACCTDDHLEDS